MEANRETQLGADGSVDSGEVPDKQLHRWKGEGGALPPEPDEEDSGGHELEGGDDPEPETT